MRYLALAHNQRVGTATKANVLLNLGREGRLDPDGLRRLVRSINRYRGEPDPDTGTDAAAATGTTEAPEGLGLIISCPAGAAWLLDGLWKALDVDTALRTVLGGRRVGRARFSTDVERVLFARRCGRRGRRVLAVVTPGVVCRIWVAALADGRVGVARAESGCPNATLCSAHKEAAPLPARRRPCVMPIGAQSKAV